MNLMNSLAPKEVSSNTKVVSLDSGEVKEYDTPKPESLDSGYKQQDKSYYKLIDIYSKCNEHFIYEEQLKKLPIITHKKFSSESEMIHREFKLGEIKKYSSYMKHVFDNYEIEFNIDIQLEYSILNSKIKDTLYFKEDIIYIPIEYNYIIDSVLSKFKHNFTRIKFCNHHDTERIILPVEEFNILTINKQFCNECEFYSICDKK